MKKCPKCNWQNKDEAQECANCGFSLEIVKPIEKTAEEQIGEAISTIAIFTAPIINNVKDYLGTVSYEVIFGTNFFKKL